MKVLYITDIVETYGASNSFKEMVRILNDNYNIEPIILTSKDGIISKYARDNRFETYAIGHECVLFRNSENKFKNFIKRIIIKPYYKIKVYCKEVRAIKRAEKYVDFSTIDIIHSNVNRNDIGALLAKRNGVPHVMHLREFSDLDFNYYPLYSNFIDLLNNNTSKFIAISNIIKEHWIHKGIGEEKIETIYNGVDDTKFVPKKKFSDGKIHIIFSGAIVPTKGQKEAVQAMALIKKKYKEKIVLDIYGSGDERYIQEIEDIIASNKLKEIVRFKGYSDKIYDEVGKYDVGLVCSKSEGFGRVTAEYMHSGLVVVASNRGANTELIANNINGLLYEYGDPKDLANQLERIIENKNDFVNKMGINAIKTADEKFTAQKNAENIYRLYKKILGENKT